MQEFTRDKSLIKQNILNFLRISGISKYEFYKNSGISRGTLDNSSGLTEENILKFLTYAPLVSPSWLLLGKGEMLKNTTEISEESTLNPGIVYESQPVYVSGIPLFSVRNVAAMILLFNGLQELKPEDHLVLPGLDSCDGALYVKGDSMYPLLKGGDILVYKIMKDKLHSLLWGEMYLLAIRVETEEVSLLGYVQKSEKGEEYISVYGYNPKHESRDIHLDQIVVFAHIRASVRIN